MTNLSGSEKQIQWANDIQAQFERTLQEHIAVARLRTNEGSIPATWAPAVEQAAQSLRDAVARDMQGQAKMWIEHRARIFVFAQRVNEVAIRQQQQEVK
jgi:hypothetical protein